MKNVIDGKYLPTRPIGVLQWLIVVLALDYWSAPGWLWGLTLGVLGLATIGLWHVYLITENKVHPKELLK